MGEYTFPPCGELKDLLFLFMIFGALGGGINGVGFAVCLAVIVFETWNLLAKVTVRW